MKRMIPQSLITWVKSLFTRIRPGDKEGDIEIGGNLEVNGKLTANGGINCDEPLPFIDAGDVYGKIDTGGGFFALYQENTSNNYHHGIIASKAFGTSIGILPNSGLSPRTGYYIKPNEIGIYFNGSQTGKITSSGITIGSTSLSEAQLKKLLALIPAE